MCYYFNARTVHNLLLLYQPTNSQIYYTTISLYTMYTPVRFDITMSLSGNLIFVSNLHKFLLLELLKCSFIKLLF